MSLGQASCAIYFGKPRPVLGTREMQTECSILGGFGAFS